MATIYELMQNMNPEVNNVNQQKMSIQDLIAMQKQKEENEFNQQNLQQQSQQTSQAQSNIAPQPESEKSNAQTIKDLINSDVQKNIGDLKNFNIQNLMENKPKITPEMEPYEGKPRPYSAKDFGKYFKKGKGFWGKTGGALADLLMALNTPEGQKLTGSLLSATTGNPYMVGAANEQAKMTAERQAQEQQRYNDYIKDLRKTSTEYDMKMMDLLGKEAYSALKGGKGIIFVDKKDGKGYLPVTQEDGTIKNVEVNASEYVKNGYKEVPLFKPEIDQVAVYQSKQDIRTQAAIDRAEALSPIQTKTALNTEIGKENIKMGNILKIDKIKREAEKGKISMADAGRYVLANDSIKDVNEVRDILFPNGKTSSFKRDIAAGINPFDKDTQKVQTRVARMLSAKLLLQSGVAVRPEELATQAKAFIANWKSNPDVAMENLDSLANFYDQITTIAREKEIPEASININKSKTKPAKKEDEKLMKKYNF
jgi:hypothetical protein